MAWLLVGVGLAMYSVGVLILLVVPGDNLVPMLVWSAGFVSPS